MTQAGTTAYGYDYWGNVTQIGTGNFYYWDDADRLARYDGAGTINDTTYNYFPASWQRAKRVKEQTPPLTRLFAWDGADLQGLYDQNGARMWTFETPGLDNHLSAWTGGNTYYFMQDAQGSIRHVADSGQNTQSTYDYRAYGEVLGTYSQTVQSPFRYTGAFYENWHGMTYYMRNRTYMPGVGLFSSRDAMWADRARGWGYVGNSPSDLIDPMGLRVTIVVGGGTPPDFVDNVVTGFQADMGNAGIVGAVPGAEGTDVTATPTGTSANPAAIRNFNRLNGAITNPRPIYIHYSKGQSETKLWSPETFEPCSPRAGAEVYIDPALKVKRPTVDPNDPDKKGPDEYVPFPAALWHEAMGHGAGGIGGGPAWRYDHLREDWNLQTNPRNGGYDFVIRIENQARQVLSGPNLVVPLRWYQYYRIKWAP